ncbi:hypothetical protein [Actinokineospora sp.]|uniref:hypothetical protein n=1 Tax=Actinokineospora sp. TaxID=1872133 RepID=UPI003D6C078B
MTATLPEGTVYHLRPKGRCAECGQRRQLRSDGTLRRHDQCGGSLRAPAFDLHDELAHLLYAWACDRRVIPDYRWTETIWSHTPRRVVHTDMGDRWLLRVDDGPDDDHPVVTSSGMATAQAAFELVRAMTGKVVPGGAA